MRKIISILFCLLIFSKAFAGVTAPPQPPADNPHPPITEEDKRRVAFGELAIKNLLMTSKSTFSGNMTIVDDQSIELAMTQICLESEACIKGKDTQNYLSAFKNRYGVLKTYQHIHVIPWSFEKFKNQKMAASKPIPTDTTGDSDPPKRERAAVEASIAVMPTPIVKAGQYMMHAYVQFEGSESWYHLDIIVSENKNGVMKLERFFTTQIPWPSVDLPPGVVC